jgi:hypothetical protein
VRRIINQSTINQNLVQTFLPLSSVCLLLVNDDDDDDDDESAEIRPPLAVDVGVYHVFTPAVQSSGRPSVRGVASCHLLRTQHVFFKPTQKVVNSRERAKGATRACLDGTWIESEGENERTNVSSCLSRL